MHGEPLERASTPLLRFGAGGSTAKRLIKNAWFSFGIWQVPRLRRDWNTLHDADDTHIRSMNAFFDTMFAISITHLGMELRAKQNYAALVNWCQYFGVIVSLWLSTTDYSSRFDNDDLAHKLFWAMYGIGVLGILMHTTGGCMSTNAAYFSLCIGAVYGLLACHYFRNAIALPRCRFFTSVLGFFHLSCTMLGMLGYAFRSARPVTFWILALAYPLSLAIIVIATNLVAVFFFKGISFIEAKRKLDLPLHIEFHIARFSTFAMMVLGQLALAIALHPEQGFESRMGLYSAVCVAFFLLVSMKLFIFDVDYYDVEDHAIRRSVSTGLAWLILYPMGVACIALMGSGIALLVACVGKSNKYTDEEFAQWLTCSSLAIFLCIVAVQRNLHYVPYTRMLEEADHKAEARTLLAIHYFQCGIQVVAACVVGGIQWLAWSSVSVMLGLAATLATLVVVNLMDEIVLLHDASMHGAAKKFIAFANSGTAGGHRNEIKNPLR
mmetsp:Transcript_31918/g.77785  ORF Transcript_31918/g.77785 Transcript_31918/m.77785 type:complete len:494 (-) Transcript_31918:268-1749(-)